VVEAAWDAWRPVDRRIAFLMCVTDPLSSRLRPYRNDLLGTVRLASGHAPDETIDVIA